MASEELLIIVGHAWQCSDCRRKLLQSPEEIARSHFLDSAETEVLKKLTADDFLSVKRLAEVVGSTSSEIYDIMNHPRCRLRHL